MASVLSYELFVAKQGAANGIATLDADTKIPVSQLPDEAIETYKGQYDTQTDLETAYPTASLGDYAYVGDLTAAGSYWYWNAALATPAWVNQQITEEDYEDLSDLEKSVVPYIVVE